ncbi:type IV secretion system protein [Sphingorhabdus soli]|uniref:Type IV secretion system protein n=1 Tax=Flavisphingopyxis soli TaxID=2601267 RepID=A0A5C6U641_9SPHN|nr:type IV secretion system protein [Sphingorhabdus soli]TXC68324.1 type IV secretion system protein [Sphingorhabdus soli]
MFAACPTLETGSPFLANMLGQVDCQAQNLGSFGYQALASPGSPLSSLLTLALTIFVALIGYRLLIGSPPQGRELVPTAIKVGIVLLLATSWPAFNIVVYDVAMRGPAELAQSIGEPAGIPGATGGLIDRLQRADDAMAELLVRGPGQMNGVAGTNPSPTGAWVPFDSLRAGNRLEQSRTLFLTSSIAAFGSVRLVAGLLLALGPLFALFLLFDGTRGLFEGWLRGLVGAALGATGTAIVLGIELSLIEPLLAGALALRRANAVAASVPVELLVVTLVFALVLLAVLIASAKVAYGLRLPVRFAQIADRWSRPRAFSPEQRERIGTGGAVALDDRSRALAVADAVSATQRREQQATTASAASGVSRATMVSSRLQQGERPAAMAAGQSMQRRTRGRVSASANRRSLR